MGFMYVVPYRTFIQLSEWVFVQEKLQQYNSTGLLQEHYKTNVGTYLVVFYQKITSKMLWVILLVWLLDIVQF